MKPPTVAVNTGGTRMHTDMGYVCARLRARAQLLLAAPALEALRRLPTLAELFSALLHTEYGPSLKARVLDVNDLGEWEAAFTATFARRVSQVRAWIDATVPAYAYLVDGEWDVHHLRSLLRRLDQPGTERAVGPEFVPLGALTRERYDTALAAQSPAEFCTLLQPWLPAWSACLRSFLEPPRQPPLGWREIELQLDDEHFRRLARCARRLGRWDDAAILRRYVALLIDRTNLRTALRFLGRHLPQDQVARFYVPGGTLTGAEFVALLAADSNEGMCRRLPRGALRAAVGQGLARAASTGRVSAFERWGDERLLQLTRRLARQCPVSVAMPLSYLARARNEWINLKLIACGIRYRLAADRVREGLVYV